MIIFRDRYFNLALAASLGGHIIFILLFSPFVKSGDVKLYDTSISFLGSVLDRACFSNERHVVWDRFHPDSEQNREDRLGMELFPLQKCDADFSNSQPIKEKIILESQVKEDILKISNIRKDLQLNLSNILIKGPGRNRLIVYKPELPRALIFPSEFSSSYTANIKFKISKYGFVERPEFVVSSGSCEIDKAALRHIRKWQFAPSVEGQEGVVRINIEIK